MITLHQRAERHLVRVLVRMLLRPEDAGITVWSGGTYPDLVRDRSVDQIVDAVYAVYSCSLHVYRGDARLGVVQLVLGNAPWEVVCDHSATGHVADICDLWSAVADEVEHIFSELGV